MKWIFVVCWTAACPPSDLTIVRDLSARHCQSLLFLHELRTKGDRLRTKAGKEYAYSAECLSDTGFYYSQSALFDVDRLEEFRNNVREMSGKNAAMQTANAIQLMGEIIDLVGKMKTEAEEEVQRRKTKAKE